MRTLTFVLAVALAAVGCGKSDDAKKGTGSGSGSGSSVAVGSGSGSATGSGSAGSGSGMASNNGSGSAGSDAGSGTGSGSGSGASDAAMTHHAGNCPSTVAKATTTAEVKDKNVVVTIVSDDKDAVLAIQKRTDELIAGRKEHKAAASQSDKHAQNGMHGGGMGLCPIYTPEGVEADAKHIDKGVAVTLTGGKDADAIKKEVDTRIQKSADWVKANIPADGKGPSGTQGGTGGGGNGEGMNHSGKGDGKGKERKGNGKGDGTGGGKGDGTGGGKGKGSGATP